MADSREELLISHAAIRFPQQETFEMTQKELHT